MTYDMLLRVAGLFAFDFFFHPDLQFIPAQD
jgi:hypothetical protein